MEKDKRKVPGMKEWLLILAAGAVLLILSIPDLSKKSKEAESKPVISNDSEAPKQSFCEQMEKKLSGLLLDMDGVTGVKVMITLKSSEEEVILRDFSGNREETKEEDSSGGKREALTESREEAAVLSDGVPYVTKEMMPKVEGVVILLKGGTAETVLSVSEAVQALFDVPAHKVRVIKNGTGG